MAVKVDLQKCTGCGTCVDVCPTEALKVKSGKVVVSQDDCTECETCIAECPEEALNM